MRNLTLIKNRANYHLKANVFEVKGKEITNTINRYEGNDLSMIYEKGFYTCSITGHKNTAQTINDAAILLIGLYKPH